MYESLILWVRVGDAGGYESFDSLDEVASMFAEWNISGPFELYRSGVQCDGYESMNYISLYWGNEANAEMVRGLDESELDELNELVQQSMPRW
jgi:hypothetical protein